MTLTASLSEWAALQGIGKKPRTQKYHQEIIALILRHWPGAPDDDVDVVSKATVTENLVFFDSVTWSEQQSVHWAPRRPPAK